jgi:hypothetical protein
MQFYAKIVHDNYVTGTASELTVFSLNMTFLRIKVYDPIPKLIFLSFPPTVVVLWLTPPFVFSRSPIQILTRKSGILIEVICGFS